MPRLHIENRSRELTDECSWTDEQVELSWGDIYLDGTPFGTYFAASYPQSGRPPHFVVNVVGSSGVATLSIPFEFDPGAAERVRAISEKTSPWGSDGILVGPIPEDPQSATYTRIAQVLEVAAELVLVEPNLASYRSDA